MVRWAGSWLAMVALAVASPVVAQGFGGSDGEAFLDAVEKGEAGKALPLLEEPGSRVANYKGYKGDTALHIVTRRRDLPWVGTLLKKGADPNIGDSQGDTPLHIAARIGFEQAADYMLIMGAKADVTNRRGETALIVAVQQKRPELVELLLKAGADPDKADYAAGYSARDYAKRDSRNPQLLRLIESVKSTRKKVSGPSLN